LKAAEEEAQLLKKQLAAAQAGTSGAAPVEEEQRPPATSRIDGGDLRRETLAFVGEDIVWNTLVAALHFRHSCCPCEFPGNAFIVQWNTFLCRNEAAQLVE